MSVKSALKIKINGQWVAVPVIAGEGSGGEGAAGADGGYYTPAVSSEGLLNWTPSKDGMPAVASADIRGPKGDTGPAGSDGAPGKDGTSVTVASVNTSSEDGGSNVVTFSDGKTLTVKNGSKGSTGDQGPAGSDGAPGKDGTSVTVANVSTSSADGGSNVVTFSDGKTLTVKNGSKGGQGNPGNPGKDGTSVTVSNVSESTADGGNNVVTFSDGKTVTIKNGSKGSQGNPGYTPQKGVDYRDGEDGKDAVTSAVALTIASTAWTGDEAPYTATVTCNGVTASNNIIVGAGGALTAEQQSAMAAAMIVCTGQGANTITLSAFGEVPDIDLPVNVMIVG